MARTGGPPFSASASPVRIAPTRRLVQTTNACVSDVQALDHRLLQLVDAAVAVEGAASLVRPSAGDGGNAQSGVHVRRAVALARETKTKAEEAAFRTPDERGEFLDLRNRDAGDRARPCRIAGPHMRLEFVWRVCVPLEVVPIGQPIAKQDVDHRAGERSIRARPHAECEIGLPHRFRLIDVDGDDLRAALLARANRMGHHVDLRRDRVGSPNDDAIRLRHFARIGAHQPTGSGGISGRRDPDTDCPVVARIALGVREALDSIAHHETHRAGVEVWPNALGAELALDRQEIVSDAVERLVPTDRRELPASLGTDAAKRLGEAIRVMDALPIARDLGADDAGCVGLVARPMDAADALAADHLDVESANRRAVVRTD